MKLYGFIKDEICKILFCEQVFNYLLTLIFRNKLINIFIYFITFYIFLIYNNLSFLIYNEINLFLF
jgi:hypothetical protein